MNETRLRRYAALVARWSAKINLVSRADVPHIWERHIEDCLALVPHIPPATACAIDLGSGAGFPGLVLAIATGIPFTLIESDKRKAAFLTDAARDLGAPVKVLATRIETATPAPAPLVTARALAPLGKLIGLALPHLAPGGVCLFPKGRAAMAELAQAQTLWRMEVERFKTSADPDAVIFKLGNIHGHAG